MKKKMKKKIFSLALVIVCMAVLMVSGTLAYFTAEDTATNVITTNKIDIDLIERVEVNGESIENFHVEGVMPGQEVDKIVTVENINNARPAFIRVRLTPNITLAEENAGETVDHNVFGVDLNDTDWEFGNDGYFYYKSILGSGEETEPLFTTVFFDADMDNRYQEATFEILVEAEAVQSVNITNADGEPVTKAVDVPAEIWPGYQGEV